MNASNTPSKHSWQLYTSNEQAWQAMLETCEQAKTSIDLEQFIFLKDEIGKKFIEICARKAKEGVKVRFIWDAVGSFSFFGAGTIQELKASGIELVFFKTLFPSFYSLHNYESWYFRNHRRALIIDKKIGFTGSFCIADYTKTWKDVSIKLIGPVVKDMQKAFERMWDRANRIKVEKNKNETYSDSEFRYVSNNPIPRHRRLYKESIQLIKKAEKKIYITTPYFVPTRHLDRLLRRAGKKGLDVRLIIPEFTDHTIVDLCAKTFFHRLLKAGVKIYIHKGEMIHKKIMIIDNDIASVGTMNMDTISLLRNFEANIISKNKDFNQEVLEDFHKDLKSSKEITFQQWEKRYWLERFIGYFVRLARDFI